MEETFAVDFITTPTLEALLKLLFTFQNLLELPQLAGLEDDLGFRQEIDTQVVFYKASRYLFFGVSSEARIVIKTFTLKATDHHFNGVTFELRT